MKIRKYNPKDREKIKRHIKGILYEIFGKHKVNPFEEFKKYDLFLVAEEDDKIVATAAVYIDKNSGIIKRMYVKRSYRKKGIAQKMYNRIETYSKKRGIKTLKLSTTPQMKDAIKFYKRNGFKKIREDKEANKIFFRKALK
ncbi:MAG: GNAT family N-acetyltransferase [Candidatus Woesearchaeota archaeon]